ncbi:MAG TPA: ADOP family duplicated permease [Vicinamibacterales bacterium]|nr:ADOP family duplicated permease [Vicinamibacterales bacterium]
MKILFRAFLAQFFTSETVTSDVQMRQAISGLIAFIITPCLVLFPFSRTAGAAKLTALIAYSMITVGLVAVYAWDALTFDRRDAMVLGPLPIRGRTMVTAKLAAVGALLFGTAFAICTLNSILFALQTADRSGWQTFAVSFFSCLLATTAGAVLVFSSIVFLRAVVVMLGGERFAMMIGSLVQLVLAVALLQLLITVFLSGHRHEQLPHIHVNPALALVSLLAAIVVSIATFRQQMRRALTPSSTPGPLGHARLGRWIAAMVCGRDGIARAMSGFVLTTVARNRVHQTPIAMNAAVGIACVVISLARQHTDTLTLTVAAPLMVAYWVAIGLRASFYVPSELPAAWAFVAHAPNAFLQYARGVRAAIFGFIAPLTAVAAFLVSGWTGAGRAVLLIAALADAIVLTIRFLPFTRAYRPGHAKLKTRWPLYAVGGFVFSGGLPMLPLSAIVALIVALEIAVVRVAQRWSIEPSILEATEDSVVTSLDLIGVATTDIVPSPQPSSPPAPPVMQGATSDVRYALRLLRREPSVASIVVLTMALAIGANVTLFTIVSTMDGRSRVVDSDRAIVVTTVDRAGRPLGASYLDFVEWQARARTVSELIAYRAASVHLTDSGAGTETATGAYISADTFHLIGERPVLGRDFLQSDDRQGAIPVAILGNRLWKARYNSDPDIVGKTVRANGVDVTVVGVMRPNMRFPVVHDFWMPLMTAPGLVDEPRDARTLQVVGRLRDAASIGQARAEFAAMGDETLRPAVRPFIEGFTIANPWTAMLLAVTFVLVIGCANVANLLLARGARRTREMDIRRSLGATRWQLIRQLLVEHTVMAAVAGAAGLLVAIAGVRWWRWSMPIANWPYWYDFTIDRQVVLYLAAVTALCAVGFGIAPAVTTSRHAGAGRSRIWTNALLTVEFTLTLALLAGAGLLARTLTNIFRADAIVDTSDVAFTGIDLPTDRYKTADQQIKVYRTLEDRMMASGDIEAATVASLSPFFTAPLRVLNFEDDTARSAPASASYVIIGPHYFDTLRLSMRRGRPFMNDDGAPGHATAIVNERFAAMYFSTQDPIGRRIKLLNPQAPSARDATWLTIVGVAPTIRQHYAQDFDPVVYVPYRWNPTSTMIIMARAARPGASIMPTVRHALTSIDAELTVTNVMSLDQLLAGTRFANEAFATMFSSSAAIALMLAAIGLHAITAYSVTQRTREIGIRIALGARASTVTWLFVRRTVPALLVGTALGLGAALGVGGFVQSMLAGTSPHDPATLVAITLVLVAVVLLSAFVPARRAARLEPTAALRHE